MVVFPEPTPQQIIRTVRPKVLVKGLEPVPHRGWEPRWSGTGRSARHSPPERHLNDRPPAKGFFRGAGGEFPIASLLAAAGARAGLSRLTDSLKAQGRVALSGLSGSARALHLLLLQRSLGRSVLLVTAGDPETERWERDLRTWKRWLGADSPAVDVLPSLDADPYQGLSPHLQVSCDRVVALNHLLSDRPAVILVPARSLFYRVPSPGAFRRLTPSPASRRPLSARIACVAC